MAVVEHLAKIAAKNHKHTLNNPCSRFWAGYDEATVLASPQISLSTRAAQPPPFRISIPLSSHYDYPLPLPAEQDGAVCCIVTNEAFLRANKLETQAIQPVATRIGMDFADASVGRSAMDTVGHGMTRRLEDKVFTQAGTSRDDVGIVQLHNCFAADKVGSKSYSEGLLQLAKL
ncbi:hypothetical protein EDB85DRAFT_1939719 [Lactarius pseudohatsudake]|nr:hypothetical protein EDB85DRAFT_1939719 [Lactarius pseudohatsudake]